MFNFKYDFLKMPNNYIDIKETIWRRYHFSDEANMEEIIKELEKGSFDIFDIDSAKFQESEVLYDTGQSITPEENGGEPTIEVYNKEVMIWDNVNHN